MKEDDLIVSGSDETREDSNIFTIPSEWVNAPHLQIKYNKDEDKFYLASFGEITTLNEIAIERSDVSSPKWVELPVNSRMLLNGIIGLNLFKA